MTDSPHDLNATRKQTSQQAIGKRQTRRRRMLFASFAVLLGIVAAGGLAEILLRIHVASRGWTSNCYVTGLAFFVPDALAGQTLRPGLRMRSSAYDVRVNSLGFRGPELAVQSDPEVTRIAVLGGSSVFGYLVGEGDDSCRLLESQLRADGYKVEVINAGVPGFTVSQCLARFQTKVAPLKPQIVLLYLGWNDLPNLLSNEPDTIRLPKPPSWTQRLLIRSVLYGFLRYRLFPPSTPSFTPPADAATTANRSGMNRFQNSLSQLIKEIRQRQAIPIVSTQLMAAGPTCDGLETFLGSTPAQIDTNRRLASIVTRLVRETARKHEVPVIEITDCVPCSNQTLGDAIHLTAKGHLLVAQCWAKQIEKRVQPIP